LEAEASGYTTYQNHLVDNSRDFQRHIISGDTAWAELDALSIAIDIIDITGNYVAGLAVFDALGSIEDSSGGGSRAANEEP
jgi:hypothetical protein